jgi:hypothetical protein
MVPGRNDATGAEADEFQICGESSVRACEVVCVRFGCIGIAQTVHFQIMTFLQQVSCLLEHVGENRSELRMRCRA